MRKFFSVMIAAVVLAFAGSTSALAHDELLSSDPTDQAVLTTAPTQVTLTFSDTLTETTSDQDNMISVIDVNSTQWTAGAVTVTGQEMNVELASGLPEGGYLILWRAVSKDGHPLSGSLSFSVGQMAYEIPVPGDSDLGSGTEGSGEGDKNVVDAPIEMQQSVTETVPDRVPVWVAFLGSALVGLAVLGAWWLFARTRTKA